MKNEIISKIKNYICNHKYVIENVNISDDLINMCKIISSYTNSKIYDRFIIPNNSEYKKCVKCGKVKK